MRFINKQFEMHFKNKLTFLTYNHNPSSGANNSTFGFITNELSLARLLVDSLKV